MRQDKDQIWKEILDSLKVSVSPAIFSTWLNHTHLHSLKKVDDKRYTAEIGCHSLFVRATVEQRYYGLIQDSLIKTLGTACDLTFVVKQVQNATLKKESEKTPSAAPLFQQDEYDDALMNKFAVSRLRPFFIFNNFAVSASNQMAWAAAEAVAAKPGYAYNPLFLWGGVGVGKTHLMNAVGIHILKHDPSAKVLACTGEDFTNDIVEGIRNKTTQSFRDKYRKLKVLLIDDIQFIAGKDAVQDEFFHTFNAMTAAGGQVILTSDRPPSEIARLEERLRSRFEAGLIVDISPPDFELRCAIVQIKSEERELGITTEFVHLIAANLDSARKIEGFLIRLSSETKIRKIPVSEEIIKSLLNKGYDEITPRKRTTPDKIIDAVITHYSVTKRALMGAARAKTIALPRQILMYLLRTELAIPYEEVGRITGGRNHSTVIHAVDKITQLASDDVHIREDILGIKKHM